jgi:hypothetical protein
MDPPDRFEDENEAPTGEGTIRADFDWSAVDPSTAVVETVAIAADRKPTTIQPLYDAIDPGALDTFLRSGELDSTTPERAVSFTYMDYQVTVTGEGSITVSPAP